VDQLEQEEKYLFEAYENGEIDEHEFNHSINELYRDAHAARGEDAQRAYDEVMNQW